MGLVPLGPPGDSRERTFEVLHPQEQEAGLLVQFPLSLAKGAPKVHIPQYVSLQEAELLLRDWV